MSLPPWAPIPPSSIRRSIAPEEWDACLESWLTLAGLYLQLPPKQFSTISTSEGSLLEFVSSLYREAARIETGDSTLDNTKAQQLRSISFKLVHRLYHDSNPAKLLFQFEFLADICSVHRRNASLSRLISEIWQQGSQYPQQAMQLEKNAIFKKLESSSSAGDRNCLRRVADLMLASPDAAALFMTGSDFLDALITAYGKADDVRGRRSLIAIVYLGLQSLLMVKPQNTSLLSDHLYTLKAAADQKSGRPSLLSELVTNTHLVIKLRRIASGASTERLSKVLDTLETYYTSSIAQPRKHARHMPDKSRGKTKQSHDELHVHRMSLVTQVQDLFPELGSGFVLKLLDEYGDNVEEVTANLLDDSLPAHLRDLDRGEQTSTLQNSHRSEIEQLAPRSTPPPPEPLIPQRRNVFDNDEFDRMAIDTSKLHIGKKKDVTTKGQANKAAILSALVAFDADDDERDDTYDVDDVGGTVDTAHPDGEPGPSAKVTQEENDAALFTAYKESPSLFGRAFDVRRGQARQALKAETGMTDEAIEGWAIMLQREPQRLKRLEAQMGSFDGKQTELTRTAYRESPAGTETEDSDAGPSRGGYQGRSRGRGRGGRGRGGNVAGPSNDANTAAAQRRKEANKGSRANHNRRDQRARKMARGGFAGS